VNSVPLSTFAHASNAIAAAGIFGGNRRHRRLIGIAL
jgi:hypothetical protein